MTGLLERRKVKLREVVRGLNEAACIYAEFTISLLNQERRRKCLICLLHITVVAVDHKHAIIVSCEVIVE
uniref:Uncharacterized protein n=1 Tax=Ascaris lumbricoides TaxID=6252 RepID=A0A0M3IE42_ASCLU